LPGALPAPGALLQQANKVAVPVAGSGHLVLYSSGMRNASVHAQIHRLILRYLQPFFLHQNFLNLILTRQGSAMNIGFLNDPFYYF